jgi:IS5 family transposase
MVIRRKQDRSLFEGLLPDSDKLWPAWLKRIDTLLENEAVIDTIAAALEQRWPQSRTRGRAGTPADVVLRMLILKHLHDWSFDELEQEVRANLVYRAFTRIGVDAVPDAKTILKIAKALGPEVITDLHRRVVDVAKRAGVTHGRRFRIDTTVVETNVHYPTDSTLLQDGVRVLTRTMARANDAMGAPPVRNRLRRVTRLGLAISFQSRTVKTRAAMTDSYRRLMATTRAVIRDTHRMVRRIAQHARKATGRTATLLQRAQQKLQQMRPLVQRVLAQTRARVVGGDTHVPHKVLSVFEVHTEAIRKGKIAKPTEFGKLVTIQESEQQIVTAFEVHADRPADTQLWAPALDRHRTSLAARRISPPPIRASRRRPMNAPPTIAASAVWCSPRAVRNHRVDVRMNTSAGFAVASAGAPAAKAASASSNVGTVYVALAIVATTGSIAASASGPSATT